MESWGAEDPSRDCGGEWGPRWRLGEGLENQVESGRGVGDPEGGWSGPEELKVFWASC